MAEKYLPVSHFLVDWGGARLGFSEVSGLEIENSVIEYREGSSPENKTIKMPGLTKFGNIVLKRGIIAGDNDFFTWFNTTQLNKVDRRDLTISLLDEEHNPTMVWRAKNAFPAKIQGPTLNAESGEIAIETLEVAHEGLVIVNG